MGRANEVLLIASVSVMVGFPTPAAADDDIEEVLVIGSNKDPFVSRATSLEDYCAMYPGLGICDLLDAETSMGPSPGSYDEPQPCGSGSTDGSCTCPKKGEEKVYHEDRNRFLCMDEEQVLTHRVDGCMRGVAPDRLGGIVPHELRFASFGRSGEWGQAGRLANRVYYTRLDLDRIRKSLKAGELGYPGEAALHRRSSLSEGIHFVLGHEYVHHKWPGSEHGELFNRRANDIRNATRGCK